MDSTNTIDKETFLVQGMSCAACATSVESMLNHTEGVQEAEVNFPNHQVTITYQQGTNRQSFKEALQSIGYDLDLETEQKKQKARKQRQEQYEKLKKQTIWSALFAIPVFAIAMFFGSWQWGPYISGFLSLPVLFIWGAHFYTNAWKQARHGLATMDTLVALSTGIAFLFSLFNTFYPEFWTSKGLEAHVYFEAAVVIITFVSLGKTLEERAKSSTSQALEQLMDLQAKQVLMLDADGSESLVDLEKVGLGDQIRVKPGESIPVDGEIIEGQSSIDESMLSGESLAIQKSKGDAVYAGTLNQKGSLILKVTKQSKDTVLAQIIRLVEEAQGSKAPIQNLVNKIAGIFVPAVLGIALLTFAVWMIAGGEEAFAHAIYTAIAVLVIACPCALGLATPTAIMVGIGKGAANNILIRDAESIELAPKVNTLVLDKTGTLSQAKAQVLQMEWFNRGREKASALLALQEQSQHPLATAIVRYLKEAEFKSKKLQNFEIIEARGVKMTNPDGGYFASGNERFVEESGLPLTESHQAKAKEWQNKGATVIYFFNQDGILAQLIIGDPLKKGSKSAVTELQNLGIELMILSGDKNETTAYWAKELGVENFRAEVLPQDKGAVVRELQEQGKVVAMVGDGINDSEALAQADLSIAMGHGSDIAIEAAKMTLMTSDLRSIPKAIRLSKFTVQGIRQNLFWAFIYNLIGIPLAAGILYPVNGFLLDPMIAGAAMAFSSVSVVLNSLRLRGKEL